MRQPQYRPDPREDSDRFTTFDTEVTIPVTVTITSYRPGRAGYRHGAPENCYPDEPDEIEYEVKAADGTPLFSDAHGIDEDTITEEALQIAKEHGNGR